VTQNNHLTVTYITDGTTNHTATVQIGSPRQTDNSPLWETTKAAQNLAELYSGKNIYLCLSGGVDSECMLDSFVKARVDFCPVLLSFEGGHNEFDLRHARQACRRHGLSWIEKSINLDHFYNSNDFYQIAEKTKCRSPMLAVHMWLFLELDGVPICAWNAPRILVEENKKIRLTLPQELYFAYQRYVQTWQRPLRPFFFLENPEIYYSFFQLHFVQDLLRAPEKWTTQYHPDEYFLKCHMYRCAGYQFSDKTYKYTGFERYKKHVAALYTSDEHEYTRRYRMPLEKRFLAPQTTYAKINLDYVFAGESPVPYLGNFHKLVPWDSTLSFQM
jgi:hypothetical protein